MTYYCLQGKRKNLTMGSPTEWAEQTSACKEGNQEAEGVREQVLFVVFFHNSFPSGVFHSSSLTSLEDFFVSKHKYEYP